MTQDELKSLVYYREDGNLIWKEREPVDRIAKTFNSKFAGKVVGSLATTGYLETAIKQKRYLVHRLVFLYHHGYMPEFVEHKDTDKLNNRILNLREATHEQNMQNVGIKSNNRSGAKVKGVSQYGKHGLWRVQIMCGGVLHTKASFLSAEEAEEYAKELIAKLHKDFAREK
ncbi:homing endonuclease [Pectobacterium phage POP15]|uniref:HNH nuclease domain-containing protein n=1 Tax=Cronobacter phage PBES 02 TaxID=1684115 RepID=A0A0K1YAE4_9CAUD|nr:hypothetical protein ADU18_0175 [Cronobacter phage PBES 02]AKY04075.1 hypothetical protein ADU18_0175 [Cronobacter phage PBES 02]QPI18116.1 homing endonuclease [Pectobacterium phage POP15]